jgi:hypothetical protein
MARLRAHPVAGLGVAIAVLMAVLSLPASGDPAAPPGPTPAAKCGPRSDPETHEQGRVTTDDVTSRRAARGFTCNTALLSHIGDSGGYKVHRYVDASGHECGYFDTTLLFPLNATNGVQSPTGVWALDMHDPMNPVRTDMLETPAMQSPHESLSINTKRGLLAADLGNPITYPGHVDIYDISGDCRHPVLQSSLLVSLMGHEGNFSPDGKTFWSASPSGSLAAIDVSNPLVPVPLWSTTDYKPHGLNISDDGTRLYFADLGSDHGLTILDVSDVQNRVANPAPKLVSHMTWSNVSIPQNAIPVTIRKHPYIVEFDEFSRNVNFTSDSYNPADPVGAARIIDMADEKHPRVVSNMRLAVNQPENRAGDQQNDPGAKSGLQGYAAHYCAVPQRDEPGIVACSFILSGLRIFDIRDPLHPKEIAYFNAPIQPTSRTGGVGSAYAMSAATFVPERGEIWYSDGNSGFWALRVTNDVWPFKSAH